MSTNTITQKAKGTGKRKVGKTQAIVQPVQNNQAPNIPMVAFTPEIEAAFYQFQAAHPVSTHLLPDTMSEIYGWLLNPDLKPTNAKESSQWY